ncbi:hypothetical protein MNBD_GAMMA19-1371 [hydrothermal vent metagenome]|uniref:TETRATRICOPEPTIDE REPEAT FAMILY PROTEIN n=1 Tax=hydrothermal vent metagenome TaxID=652676 RepID=A0A3B1AN92_9ZZZZ
MRIIFFLFFILIFVSLHAETLQRTQQAAIKGEAHAQYELAIRYLKGDGVEKHSVSAIKWLKKSADQDFSSAQYKLGILYREGRKVTTDMDQAIEYLTMAAEQGNATAQYMLGDIYQQGDGVAKDLDEAQEWFELAAGHNLQKAVKALAKIEESNATALTITMPAVKKKAENRKPATESTDKTARPAYEQGMKYLRGVGVSRNYKTAKEWFLQAAEQGHAESQYQLGELLKKGKGTKKNKKLAKKWYRAAAEQGHIKAKNRLDGCDFC